MKKLLLLLWIIWLTFIGASFAADAAKVFDWCGPITNYKNEKWYSKLEKQLTDKWISTWTVDNMKNYYSYVSEICYSKSRNQVILNIPTIKTNEKRCENSSTSYWTWADYCQKNLNIFSYNIKTDKLNQAKLDTNTIYTWFSKISYESHNKNKNLKYKFMMYIWNDARNLFQNPDISTIIKNFWERKSDYINLYAWYGDMWCYSSSTFRYYYKTNIIKAESEEWGCAKWATDWGNDWYSITTNYITKTTKKIKMK